MPASSQGNLAAVEVAEEPKSTGEQKAVRRIRMTVDFPPKTAERLDRLRQLTGATSYAEVLRNSLALFEIVAEAHESKARVLIEQPDGTKEVVKWAQ